MLALIESLFLLFLAFIGLSFLIYAGGRIGKLVIHKLKFGYYPLKEEELKNKILQDQNNNLEKSNLYLKEENERMSQIILSLMEKNNA